MWDLRAGVIGPVLIRACVELRCVRAGPALCVAGGGPEDDAMDVLDVGEGIAGAAVVDLSV